MTLKSTFVVIHTCKNIERVNANKKRFPLFFDNSTVQQSIKFRTTMNTNCI